MYLYPTSHKTGVLEEGVDIVASPGAPADASDTEESDAEKAMDRIMETFAPKPKPPPPPPADEHIHVLQYNTAACI